MSSAQAACRCHLERLWQIKSEMGSCRRRSLETKDAPLVFRQRDNDDDDDDSQQVDIGASHLFSGTRSSMTTPSANSDDNAVAARERAERRQRDFATALHTIAVLTTNYVLGPGSDDEHGNDGDVDGIAGDTDGAVAANDIDRRRTAPTGADVPKQ